MSSNSDSLWKYSIVISYMGTRYCGWQKQSGSAAEGEPSIQETIEMVLRRVTGEQELNIVGSGRTDAGVHAVGQVAHFVLRKKEWPKEALFKALNSLLPRDIQVLSIHQVPLDFHAQRSAAKKQYSYYFQQGSTALPHLRPTSYWCRKTLDREAMQAALDIIKGEHDFKPFQASGAKPMLTTVRSILEAEVTWEPVQYPSVSSLHEAGFGLVRVRLVGSGFLKQMVRGIAGTLLQVGEGKRPPECFREILSSGNRDLVGPTAPARGLWLERVWYKKVGPTVF